MQEDCVFCKIVSRQLPAYVVYESDASLALLDIAPAGKGHLLLVPTSHEADLLCAAETTLETLLKTAAFLARSLKSALCCDGVNLVQNNGIAAGQSVFHLHMHIIPRWENDGAIRLWRPHAFAADKDYFDQLQTELRHAFSHKKG